MPHSYSTIFLHVVFATRERRDLIPPEMKENLYAYIGGIARNLGFRLLIAGGTTNHLHALIIVPANIAPAIAIQKIKANSSRFLGSAFGWQEGYGVFTVGASQVAQVKRYIANQESHHRSGISTRKSRSCGGNMRLRQPEFVPSPKGGSGPRRFRPHLERTLPHLLRGGLTPAVPAALSSWSLAAAAYSLI